MARPEEPPHDPHGVDPAEAAAADPVARLLDRAPPHAYLEAWARSLRRQLRAEERAGRLSVGLVRVGSELFALPTQHVVEVQPPTPIRSVPGRSSSVFLGLVSLRGEIHLCASLRTLLGVDDGAHDETAENGHRFLVVQHEGHRWALVVDGVLDFERFEASAVGRAQVTVSKSAVHFTEGVVPTPHGPAALIDIERLFEGLDGSLS